MERELKIFESTVNRVCSLNHQNELKGDEVGAHIDKGNAVGTGESRTAGIEGS
jgi:hypothetical protein